MTLCPPYSELSARYMPNWFFPPMTPELEDLRVAAEITSTCRNGPDRSAAIKDWDELARAAAAAYGPDDPRTLAAASRRARSALLYGDRSGNAMEEAGDSALRATGRLGAYAGEGSPEALFAAETSARALLAGGDAGRARASLSETARKSAASLGPAHQQTLSAERGAALAGIIEIASNDGWRSVAESERHFMRYAILMDAAPGEASQAAEAALLKLSDAARDAEKALGPGHPEALEAMDELGRGAALAGHLGLAEDSFRRALSGRRKLAGHAHPDSLASLTGLAAALAARGDGIGAFSAYMDALDRPMLGSLPEGHTLALDATNGLATALLLQGRAKLSRIGYAKAAEGRAKALGPGSRETLASLEGEALSLFALGDTEEGARVLGRVWAARAETLPAGHPDTVRTETFLARALGAPSGLDGAKSPAPAELAPGLAERLAFVRGGGAGAAGAQESGAAKAFYEAALATLAAAQGPGGPDALRARDGLAEALSASRSFCGAADAYAESRRARDTALGELHPDTLRTLLLEGEAWLACSPQAIDEMSIAMMGYSFDNHFLEKAKDTLSVALEGYDATLGPDSPEALRAADLLGRAEHALWRLGEAEGYLGRAAEGRSRTMGPEDPEALRSLAGLAEVKYHKGEREAAADLAARAFAGLAASGGEDSPDALAAERVLADALRGLDDPQAAAVHYRKVADAKRRAEGPDSDAALESEVGLAGALLDLGDAEASRDLAERAYRLLRERSLYTHPGLVRARQTLVSALWASGASEEALDQGLDNWFTMLSVLGPGNEETARATEELAGMQLAAFGSTMDDFLVAALGARKALYGDWHPLTVAARGDMCAVAARNVEAGGGAPAVCAGTLMDAAVLHGPAQPMAAVGAAGLGRAFVRLGDAPRGIFFLKEAFRVSRMFNGRLPHLDPGIRKRFRAAAGWIPRELFGALAGSGRTGEALAVLELMKEDEFARLSRGHAAPGEAAAGAPSRPIPPGRDGVKGPQQDAPAADGGGSSGAFDLFAGSPEEAAHLAWLEKARSVHDPSAGERPSLSEDWTWDYGRAELAFFESLPAMVPVRGGKRDRKLLEERRSALAKAGGAAAALYAVSGEDAVYLVLLTAGSEAFGKADVPRERLGAMAGSLRAALADASKDPRPPAGALYDSLVRPVAAELESAGEGTLLMWLDGPLRRVPPAALWDGERWLLESRPTAWLAPSAMGKPPSSPARGKASARAMGVASELGGRPADPSAAGEIAAVAGAVGALPGRTFLDADFTLDALAGSLASGAQVAHVASPLRLGPPGLAPGGLLLGDGTSAALGDILPAPDAARWTAAVVALSRLDASGGAMRGDAGELEALGEHFLKAGASSLIATLWPAEGPPAAALARELYRLRYAAREPMASALRGAQLAVMRDAEAEAPTPAPPAPAPAAAPGGGGGGTPPDIAGGDGTSDAGGDGGGRPSGAGGDGAEGGLPSGADGDGAEGGLPPGADGNGAEGGRPSGADGDGDALSGAADDPSPDGIKELPPWEGTGSSHPHWWAGFVLIGDWR
jgi:CHAT domain-containing protein